MKISHVTVSILILLFSSSCGKFERCETPPPNILYFTVHKEGQALDRVTNANLKMFYINSNGQRTYDPGKNLNDTVIMLPPSRVSCSLDDSIFWAAAYIRPLKYNTNFWYLEFPDGDIDTLEVHTVTEPLSCKQIKENRCHCDMPFTVVKFNGKDAPEYTAENSSDGKAVYLFNKP